MADSSYKPNRYDYWAKPEHAEQTQTAIGRAREYAAPFVSALLPIAEAFLNQEVPPTGNVPISPPSNFQQLGFARPDLLVFAVLNDQVKTITQSRNYLGGVVLAHRIYEPYELQGPSTTIALGDVEDVRPPGEYASLALAMPASNNLGTNFAVTWLARLQQQA